MKHCGGAAAALKVETSPEENKQSEGLDEGEKAGWRVLRQEKRRLALEGGV